MFLCACISFRVRSPAGGCCDCGDLISWRLEGCCPAHRPAAIPALESLLPPACLPVVEAALAAAALVALDACRALDPTTQARVAEVQEVADYGPLEEYSAPLRLLGNIHALAQVALVARDTCLWRNLASTTTVNLACFMTAARYQR